MEHLWSPWRYTYVTTADSATRPGVPEKLNAWSGDHKCVFCNMIASVDYAIGNGMKDEDAESVAGIVVRGKFCYVCLNAFPYNSGHVMIVPYAHLDRLALLPHESAQELMALTQRVEGVLTELYKPHGINIGMNLGRAAGAGVAGHLHMHALPRWEGDTNFMSTIGETRILPEELDITWKRMREVFGKE